jgi:hypothetical protein
MGAKLIIPAEPEWGDTKIRYVGSRPSLYKMPKLVIGNEEFEVEYIKNDGGSVWYINIVIPAKDLEVVNRGE